MGGPLPECVAVRDSTMVGAGMGLFATRPLARGTRVGCYGGLVVPADAEGDYVLAVRRSRAEGGPYAVDARDAATGQVHWSGRVNHAPHAWANAEWKHDAATDAVVLTLRADVAAGAELTVDYGPDYHMLYDAHAFVRAAAAAPAAGGAGRR